MRHRFLLLILLLVAYPAFADPIPYEGPITFVLKPPGGGVDAAPAFQAAVGSNNYVLVVPGNYTFCSTSVGGGYPATGLTSVYIANKTNFVLDMSGSTITICNAIASGAGTSYFQFDGNTNYRVIGGNFVGNMTGRTGGGNTVGIQTFNAVGFQYSNQVFTGDWQSLGGGGAAYDGDFMINGTFDGAVMNDVSLCFDFAFLKNVTFRDFFASGKFQGGVGLTCYSNIYDTLLLGQNHTWVTINDTSNVTIANGHVTGFSTGWSIASGNGYSLSNNYWDTNPGTASVAGFGGLVNYIDGGNFTSVGHPPGNILVSGDHYIGNGNASGGGGGITVILPPAARGDTITGLSVNASFVGNQTNAIEASLALAGSTLAQVKNIDLRALCTPGAPQTNCIGANLGAVTADAGATIASVRSLGSTYADKGIIVSGGAKSYESSIVDAGIAVGSGAGDCGTTPSISGSNEVGRVVVGGGANGGVCTVTFSVAMPTVPVCSVWNETSPARQPYPVPIGATLKITAQSTFTAGDSLSYQCKVFQ